MNDNKALREALQYLVDELKRDASKNGLGPARLMHALCKAEAALASQPEQAPFPLSDIEIEKVIAKIRPVVDSEFINGIHPNAQTQTNLVLTALKQVLEERVAAPAPAEEAGTPFDCYYDPMTLCMDREKCKEVCQWPLYKEKQLSKAGRLVWSLAEKAKELVEGMRERVKRDPNKADYRSAFTPIIIEHAAGQAAKGGREA